MRAGRPVAVWGSYHYGNFGDDLMAEAFARAIAQWGGAPTIVSTNAAVVGAGVADVVARLDDWPSDGPVVIGGGAMLAVDSWLTYALRPASRAVEREFADLVRYCRQRSPRVLPVSIGGGGSDDAGIYGHRDRFFRGPWAPRGTVRLRGDVELVRRRWGKGYEWHPDVLFATPALLERAPPPKVRGAAASRPRIGVNLHAKRAEAAVAALAARFGAAVDVTPVTTHSDVFATPYEWGHGRADAVAYRTLAPFLDAVEGLAAIVSDKLHVGLVAATLGVPFVSYQGKAKTTALHRELGLADAVCDAPAALAAAVGRCIDGRAPRTLVDAIEAEALGERALGHLHFLREQLDA